jgi:hypothetical protein
MRRAPLVLTLLMGTTLLAAGASLASCGKSEPASSVGGATTAPQHGSTGRGEAAARAQRRQALAFARAVNLTAADIPGFAQSDRHESSSPSEKRLERQMLRCAGLAGSVKALVEQSSKEFRLKHGIIDFSVSSEVAVDRTAAQAAGGLTAVHSSRVRGCFTRYLNRIFKEEHVHGATPGRVTIESGTPPAAGTSGGFGWRVTARFEVHGIEIPIYLDFLGFVYGPSEVTLLSSGLLSPFPASVQQHLFALLLTRAKEHTP